MSNLRRQVMSGMAWQGSGRFAERAIRFGANFMLARLLAPDDFGAFAALLFPVALIDSLCYFATGPVIIQSPRGETSRFLRTILAINNIRGLVLSLVLICLAPVFTLYFERPDLLPLFLVAAVQPSIAGFESPRIHVLARTMRFGRLAVYRVIASLIGSSVALAIAWSEPTVWALLMGQVGGVVGSTLMTWVIAPMRFSWAFDRDSISVIRSYALRALGTPALIMLISQAPPLLLGRTGDLGELGIFSMNARLAELPVYITLTVAGAVLIPAYSTLQDDRERLRRAWIRAWSGVTFLAVPSAILLAWMSDALPAVVWGERYASSRPLMPILAINGLLSCLLAVTGPLFWGVGLPSIDRLMQGARVVVLFLVGVFLLGSFGSIGVAWSLTAGLVAALLIAVPKALRIVGGGGRPLVRASLPAAVSGALLGSMLLAVDRIWDLDSPERVLIGLVSGVTYGSIVALRLLHGRKRQSAPDPGAV